MAATCIRIPNLCPSVAIYREPNVFSQGKNRRVSMLCCVQHQPAAVSSRIKNSSCLSGHNSFDFHNRCQCCYFEIPKSNSRRRSRERVSRMVVQKAMFERFNVEAIKVIMLSQEEGRRLGHNFVGTEQLLLGLINEDTGIAAKVLKSMGINLKDARVEVEKIIGRGRGFVAVEIPFTPRAQRVLDLSLEEAKKLVGLNYYVGPEHLLLGLIREGDGVAARVLANLGVDPSNIRAQVIKKVSGSDNEVIDSSSFSDPLNQVSTDKQRKFHRGSLRSCTKVQKHGTALGRSVDLAKFNGYDELISELDQLFEFNGELKARNKNWLIVYTDDEGDLMLVGDDPWQEFSNMVRKMVRKIYIYTRDEVQRMNPKKGA